MHAAPHVSQGGCAMSTSSSSSKPERSRSLGRRRWLRATVTLLLIPAVSATAAAMTSPASAGGKVSAAVDRAGGFPQWYEDSAGNRVEACVDAGDPNCVLPTTGYNPAAPLSVPDNYPDEFFYALANSDVVDTLGCAGTAPGKASVTIALEGAF